MYVCLCKGLTEGDLNSLAKVIGPDLECVQRSCGAATDCGACLAKVEKVLRECSSGERERTEALTAG